MATNVQKLHKAGVIHARTASAAHKAIINKLSAAEVKTLIGVRRKIHQHLKIKGGKTPRGVSRAWIL